MHLALAIFLSGLVIFLHPLREALSWIIFAGTILVYTAYVAATILPILFPQCPYRTPLCDLIYASLCRTVPRVTWSQHRRKKFLSLCRRRDFSDIFDYLPRVQARNPQSLTTMESKFVQHMSTNLAAEALHWLFSVSSNPTVQSIVIQSIGGLPMASEKMFLKLRGDSEEIVTELRKSLLGHCLLKTKYSDTFYYEPVPGMELKLGRLLRFNAGYYDYSSFIHTAGIYSFELTAAILSNRCTLRDRETLNESVGPGAFLMDNMCSSKLSPRGWHRLMMRAHWKDGVLDPLDPGRDNRANMFPLHLCSGILRSFDASKRSPMQDFDSPLVLGFETALPFFLEENYNNVLRMFSNFVDPSLNNLPVRLRVFVAAIKFVLHRLPLPDTSDMSHEDVCMSLSVAVNWIHCHRETFSLQEATAFILVLEDIMAPCAVPPFNIRSEWNKLFRYVIDIYRSLAAIAHSACSLRGPQSMVDYMSTQWDEIAEWYHRDEYSYESDPACRVLTDLLEKHIPVAFTVFLEKRCLHLLGNQGFTVLRAESVAMVSAYVAGILAMQQGSDGAVDAKTLQHIDYLHCPPNLFTACSILAMRGIGDIDRTAVRRDTAWDECRAKLRVLVQSDGEFFSKQHVMSGHYESSRPLQADEIEAKKVNIRYAVQVLDEFFSGGAYTMGLVS